MNDYFVPLLCPMSCVFYATCPTGKQLAKMTTLAKNYPNFNKSLHMPQKLSGYSCKT